MCINSICFQNFSNIHDSAILSFDCAWSHGRKSKQCLGALINVNRDEVIGWKVVENEDLSPQSLETKALKP